MKKRRLILLALAMTALMQSDWPVVDAAEDSNTPEVIRKVPTSTPAIALTFDDGPSQTFTPQVLALLNRYHAHATFFVIGHRAEDYPALIKAELIQHDEVANHTYSHVILQHQPVMKIESELNRGHDAVSVIRKDGAAYLFRPPRGRLTQKVSRVAEEHGYRVILWSVDSRDWSNPGVDRIVSNVMSHVNNGDIILFHDQGGDRTETIEALRQVLPQLHARGFRCVTVSELLDSVQHV